MSDLAEWQQQNHHHIYTERDGASLNYGRRGERIGGGEITPTPDYHCEKTMIFSQVDHGYL